MATMFATRTWTFLSVLIGRRTPECAIELYLMSCDLTYLSGHSVRCVPRVETSTLPLLHRTSQQVFVRTSQIAILILMNSFYWYEENNCLLKMTFLWRACAAAQFCIKPSSECRRFVRGLYDCKYRITSYHLL